MIYIENTTEVQGIFIPVSLTFRIRMQFRFILYNTVNLDTSIEEYLKTADFNKDFNLDFSAAAEPVITSGGTYYWMSLSLPDGFTEGSYEYVFLNGNAILSKGNAMVGHFKDNSTQYEKDITYEQYRADL